MAKEGTTLHDVARNLEPGTPLTDAFCRRLKSYGIFLEEYAPDDVQIVNKSLGASPRFDVIFKNEGILIRLTVSSTSVVCISTGKNYYVHDADSFQFAVQELLGIRDVYGVRISSDIDRTLTESEQK